MRLFIGDDAGKPNIRLWREVAITAFTPSATVKASEEMIYLEGELALILPSGYTLRASTHNAEAFNVFAEVGNF